MPGLARLDASGVLHCVVSRGIEQRKIFYNDMERNDFIDRLSALTHQNLESHLFSVSHRVLSLGKTIPPLNFTSHFAAFLSCQFKHHGQYQPDGLPLCENV